MFGRQFTLFRLFGFEVRADASWIIIASLITWTMATGVFPQHYKGLARSVYWLLGVVGALGLFASIVFHEFWHSFVARRYGLPMRGITLFLFGGVAEMGEEPRQPGIEFAMAAAGPAASIVLGGVLLLVSRALPGGWPDYLAGMAKYLALVNFILAAFNLLPAFPLDGGRMLRAALWRLKGDVKWATRIASSAGVGFGILLVGLGLTTLLVAGDVVGGLWYCILGLFLQSAARQAGRQVLIRDALAGRNVASLMTADPVTVRPSSSLARLADDFIHRYHFKLYPVVEEGRLLGCVTMRRVRQVARGEWERTTVMDIVEPPSGDNSVPPGMESFDALSIMYRNGLGRVMVVEGGTLVGILSPRDIYGFLSFRLGLDFSEEE